ncbi:MAG: hypothetical protein ORN51_13385 [Akkermansiaceae bacterium]|nr:hypothetical protein [Akkermansiaceae bacterium]
MNCCRKTVGCGWLGVFLVAGWVVSCVPTSASRNAAAAKDQMMLVREDPPSFGMQRLVTQAHAYPDLATFVSEKGLPDFLAETGDQQRDYLILYYLQNRKAFACRTNLGHEKKLEFAGPYPISAGEFQLLDGFQRGVAPKKGAR